MGIRLLKFDKINPEIYIDDKIKKNLDAFSRMNRSEALDWIISTRANFSDFYTYNLQKDGWEAEEFFVNQNYIDKVADELYGSGKKLRYFKEKIKNKVRPIVNRWNQEVIIDYVEKYKPDVILVREIIGIRSDFWRNFGNTSLLVSRLAAPIPSLWSPTDWDFILTSTDSYKVFFELNGISAFINHNGFDSRIIDEIKDEEKKYEVTFVGGLGKKFWVNRTRCIEYVAGKVDFKWWGYSSIKYPPDHPVSKAFQGLSSGLDMLKIYKSSKIVFNDYGEIANGMGVNQRMFEVMGTGSLLLTRDAENFKKEYPKNIFVTFKDEKDCVDKINYYLKNDKEREEIALQGHKYLMENFTYEKLMKELGEKLKEMYKKKFPDSLKVLK